VAPYLQELAENGTASRQDMSGSSTGEAPRATASRPSRRPAYPTTIVIAYAVPSQASAPAMSSADRTPTGWPL
jgi:hypothetical protein